jgi:DNA-binding beta-propeller fold protein YncE
MIATATRRASALALAALLIAGGAATGQDDPGTTLVYPPFGHCLGMHRVTKFHMFLYLGTRTSFNEPAGIAAVKLDALDDPDSTSDDDELTVFGLNSGESEIIFNTSLVNVEIYGEPGSGRGQFRNPLGIAADSRGNIFVADTGNHRIVRLLYRDAALEHVKSFGHAGSEELGFSAPSGVALGHSGTVYVADTGNDRVALLTPTGEWLRDITEDEAGAVRLEGPSSIAVVEADDPWISRRQNFVVVTDRDGERLVKLSIGGRLLGVVEADELPQPDAHFDGVAIDYYGSVYATDRPNGRIHKFDREFRYVTSIGRPGTGDMEMDEPRGITLWRRFGQIFVSERAGAQYFWIGTDILDLGASHDALSPGEDTLELTYYLTEVARVTIELVDEDGETVHVLVANRRRATGPNRERWDGMLGRRGGPAPPGSHTVRVTATPTYSSGEYFHDTAGIPLLIESPPGP